MPYINGKRVSQAEWIARNSSIQYFHTGANGANPATGPDIDPETAAPKPQPKAKPAADSSKAGGKRSQRSSKAAKAAIADAMGVKLDSPALADIDVSGLDLSEDA